MQADSEYNERQQMGQTRCALLKNGARLTLADDASGQTLVERLTAGGHGLAERAIVPDDIYGPVNFPVTGTVRRAGQPQSH